MLSELSLLALCHVGLGFDRFAKSLKSGASFQYIISLAKQVKRERPTFCE